MEYKRVEYDKYAAESGGLLASFHAAPSAEAQLAAAKHIFALQDRYLTMSTLSYIRHTVNTADPFYSAENDYYDENGPRFESLRVDFLKALTGSPHRTALEKTLGSLLFSNAQMALRAFDNRIIDDMAEENRLQSRYTKLIASAQIDFGGKKNNLSQLGYFMNSGDRQTRREAYRARTAFFMAHAQELDEIYDSLVKVRDRMAKKLGFRDFVELGYLRMTRNSYTPEDIAAFRRQVVEKIVPLTQEIYEKQRRRLGVDELMFYDEKVLFADGNPLPEGTPDEIFENGKRMYHEMSPETGEFIDFMLQNELFDVLGRANKAAGGYCTLLPDFRSPFIFANFNGTHDDIGVLTHEAGHAFEYYLARDVYPPAYRDTTADAAEIHSMSMEFFCWPWTKLFFGKNAEKYHYLHLTEALTFIPYGCAVDEFQHRVYENPGMTPEERKQTWTKLEKIYLPHLRFGDDPFFGKGGTWQRQLHIYEYPFYYIDYCLAQTCALEFWSLSLKDRGAAWQKYLRYSGFAGTKTFSGLLEAAGLHSPLKSGTLDEIAAAAKEWFDHFDESVL